MTQLEMLSKFGQSKPDFNQDLFVKSDEEIIECLKKVILSCQRNQNFIIQVDGFQVVENYDEIRQIMYDYYESSKNKSKTRMQDNIYSYINLKDSDIKLLIVYYYIAIEEKGEMVHDKLRVIIAVPRIVENYYFRINGVYYCPIYQIVEGSTYNRNSNSKTKRPSVTLRSIFMPIRVLGDNTQHLTTVQKEAVECTQYFSMIFNKFLPVMKYILGKYGLYGTLDLFHIEFLTISNEPNLSEDVYCFANKSKLFVNIPKFLYDNSTIVQAMCHTIVTTFNGHKSVKLNEVFSTEFWIKALGEEFNNFSVDKGKSILSSLEGIYDIMTRENIRLPEEKKSNIYKVLAWMVGEFNALRLKDNLDLGMKRIRWAEYIAALYAMKISVGIHRISDIGKKANIRTIIKALNTNPTFLLSSIILCKFIRYRDLVNDMDSLLATRFTYKGLAGIGEKKGNSVPDDMKSVHVSQLGRLDVESSSDQDPGVSGVLCPRVKLYGNGFFSDYQEPDNWDNEITKLMDEYRKTINACEVMKFKKDVLGIWSDKGEDIEAMMRTADILRAFRIFPDKQKEEFIVGENGMLTLEV